MLGLSIRQLRSRPFALVGVCTALCLTSAAITLFASLTAADITSNQQVDPESPSLAVIGGIFAEVSVVIAVLVVANTLGLLVRSQHRELGLLRVVAATPRQVRRIVRRQAQLLALVTAPLGWLAGGTGAHAALDALHAHGFGTGVRTVPGPAVPAAIATGVTLLVATASGAISVRRIVRLPPAAASTAVTAEPTGLGWVRALFGIAIGFGGLALSAVTVRRGGTVAAQASLPVMAVLLLALVAVGPTLAGWVAGLVGWPGRVLSARVGWLAEANLRGHARGLSCRRARPGQ